MQRVHPTARLVAASQPDTEAVRAYLREINGEEWLATREANGALTPEDLIEIAGRLCYRSFKPGLNPNVTKIRADSTAYLRNILESGHGSVLEHSSYSFIFSDVSRVFTHELARHRAGTAVSQESLRYVRLEELSFWFPDWMMAYEHQEIRVKAENILHYLEDFQRTMAIHFKLDDPSTPFSEKKRKTSFMRRFAPEGVTTSVLWTCNFRELRHVIELRTSLSAEEEMRLVFAQVARIAQEHAPHVFSDFKENATGEWVTEYRKV